MKLSFFVPGIPAPGGSKKGFVRGGKVCIVDDAKHNKPWRDRVASYAQDAYSGDPVNEPLIVRMTFWFPRPKCHYRSGKNRHLLSSRAPHDHITKPDALKLARSTEDALTGILWRDDCTTVDLWISKGYDVKPGAWIVVRSKEES